MGNAAVQVRVVHGEQHDHSGGGSERTGLLKELQAIGPVADAPTPREWAVGVLMRLAGHCDAGQKDLASCAGVNPSTASRWLNPEDDLSGGAMPLHRMHNLPPKAMFSLAADIQARGLAQLDRMAANDDAPVTTQALRLVSTVGELADAVTADDAQAVRQRAIAVFTEAERIVYATATTSCPRCRAEMMMAERICDACGLTRTKPRVHSRMETIQMIERHDWHSLNSKRGSAPKARCGKCNQYKVFDSAGDSQAAQPYCPGNVRRSIYGAGKWHGAKMAFSLPALPAINGVENATAVPKIPTLTDDEVVAKRKAHNKAKHERKIGHVFATVERSLSARQRRHIARKARFAAAQQVVTVRSISPVEPRPLMVHRGPGQTPIPVNYSQEIARRRRQREAREAKQS